MIKSETDFEKQRLLKNILKKEPLMGHGTSWTSLTPKRIWDDIVNI